MEDITKNKIKKYAQLLDKDVYDEFFTKFNSGELGDVTSFIYSKVDPNFLKSLTRTFPGMFSGDFPADRIVIPDNIKYLAGYTFNSSNIELIKIDCGAKVATNFINGGNVIKIYLTDKVKRLGSRCFNVTNDVLIITPYRENKEDKLVIPQSDINFYKEQLRFTHKKEENN